MKTIAKGFGAAVALALVASSAWAEMAQVTGSAGYRERIAIPDGGQLVVELRDVSRADAPSILLSQQRFAHTGVPQEFTLSYDPALIDDRMIYALSARIELDGDVWFRTDTHYPVLTRNGGDRADLMLVRAAAGATDAPMLDGTVWQLQTIATRELGDDIPRPTLEFFDGRVAIKTGCNSFNGEAEINGDALQLSDRMAGTLMACPPPLDQQEADVLATLQAVRSFGVEGGILSLFDIKGAAIMTLTRQ